MKRMIILGLICYSSLCIAQPQLEQYNRYRIELNNKTNQHLSTLPKILFEGYCQGLYTAYFPQSIITQADFGDFMWYFFSGEQQFSETDICADNYCNTPYFQECIKPFSLLFDIYEYEYFNKTTGLKERKIAYVQLIYEQNYYGIKQYFDGPLFKLNDIGETIHLKLGGQNLSILSLNHILNLGKYYALPIVSKEEEYKNKNQKKEENYYQD